MKKSLFWFGVLVVLTSLFIMLNTFNILNIVDPKIFSIETKGWSSSLLVPMVALFFGCFLLLKGISPSRKIGG